MKEVRTYPAVIESLSDSSAFLEEMLDTYECPMKEKMQLCIAFEEIFVNVAHYAYPGTSGDVRIEMEVEKAEDSSDSGAFITISFIDSGIPFNPLEKPDPDVTLSLEERQIGGLGIYMVKKSMDEMYYAYEGGQNILTIVKRF